MFCPFIQRHMIQRIGKYDMQYMEDPTNQYYIYDNQNNSERKTENNILDAILFYLLSSFHI